MQTYGKGGSNELRYYRLTSLEEKPKKRSQPKVKTDVKSYLPLILAFITITMLATHCFNAATALLE